MSIQSDTAFEHAYTYAGYRYDRETGLYYLNSRYYAAGIGRFLTKDTEYGEPDNPQTLNRYAYCVGDPVNLSDPSGLLPTWAKIAIGIVAIGAAAAITAATGGAALPVLIAATEIALASAAIGTVTGAITSGAGTLVSSGAIEGAAEGFMWGGVGASAGAIGAAAKGIKITEIGRLVPSNKKGEGYLGVKFKVKKANENFTTKSFEFQTHAHKGYNPHWQLNKWDPITNSISNKKSKHWTWWGRKI